ncbi:MFS transporter [Salinarimonas soli]|uniref:MFS transporter n=1 Tax=Salinarimonas soli TaxID=1638099 RepID=A0A5B2VVN8_9HYPH|nr:MFS transporter [Salinarimonas soli]KAA2242347.1 MFS transporter [Salinarimonas soli]
MAGTNEAAGEIADAPAGASLPALALGLGAFLTQFDVTAVIVALPAIGRDLGFGTAGYAWVMDAYSLVFTGTLLAAGALADRCGRRRALLAGNLVFLAASLACGLAGNGPWLWLARGAQGFGAAFVVTGAIALVSTVYPGARERARAFGLVGVVSGIAMAAGPSLGGLIAGTLGWRWIFLVNIPLCLLIAAAVPRLVPEARAGGERSIDALGIVLLTLALGALIEALLHLCEHPAWAVGGVAACLAAGALFVVRQRRCRHPVLDPAVFARPAMAAVAGLLVALSVSYWAVLVYLPMFLRAAFGWGDDTVGLALLAATLPMLVLPARGGPLAAAWGFRRFFAGALAVTGAGALVLAAAAGGAGSASLVLAGMVLLGVGAALAHPQLSGAVVALAPPEQAGMASAVTVVMRQGGFALGIALLGATLGPAPSLEAFAWLFGLGAMGAAAGIAAAGCLEPKPAGG